jgi:hypothetical protein
LVAQAAKNATRRQNCLANPGRLNQSTNVEKGRKPLGIHPLVSTYIGSKSARTRTDGNMKAVSQISSIFSNSPVLRKIPSSSGDGNGNCYQNVVGKTGYMAERLGDIPMSIASVLLMLAGDTRITAATTIHTGVALGRHTAPDGSVGTDTDGRSMSDPRNVAAVLGYAHSTVAKAFTDLEAHGYIEYRRPTGHEKRHGIHGKVRFILPHSQTR